MAKDEDVRSNNADQMFFTLRDISLAEKRALFDAEWVSQVTYGMTDPSLCSVKLRAENATDLLTELITKPARPRRRNANRANRGRTPNSAGPERYSTSEPLLSDSGNWSEPASQRNLSPATYHPTADEHAIPGPVAPNDTANSKAQSTGGTSTPNANDQNFRAGPAWFTTILN